MKYIGYGRKRGMWRVRVKVGISGEIKTLSEGFFGKEDSAADRNKAMKIRDGLCEDLSIKLNFMAAQKEAKPVDLKKMTIGELLSK